MARPEVVTYRDWKREHPDWPLTVHPSGQWSKKVRGRVHYFGPLSDPDRALRLWLQERDHLLAGIIPPTQDGGLTVRELVARHLADVDDRIATGRLSPQTRYDYVAAKRLLEDTRLAGMPVASLGPEHFTAVQSGLERSGYSRSTMRNRITAVKTVFRWGREMGLYDREIRYGPRFRPPGLHAIEIEREDRGKTRFLDREMILTALGTAAPDMQIAILLGINCGFYQGDSVVITLDHLHLDGEIPYHDFRRVKNGRERRAALWPETVKAIRDYRYNYRKPIDQTERRLLLTRRRRAHSGRGALERSWCKLLPNAPLGASLGSLRHTYATVVDLVPDQAMIDLTMGHAPRSLQKRIYSQLNLHELGRLRKIAHTVREWLFDGSVQDSP